MTPQRAFGFKLEAYGDRWADPVQLRRDLLRASAGRLWEWAASARAIQDAGDTSPEAAVKLADLEGHLVAAAYMAFGLPPVDPNSGTGVTETEMAAVLKSFLEYAEGKE